MKQLKTLILAIASLAFSLTMQAQANIAVPKVAQQSQSSHVEKAKTGSKTNKTASKPVAPTTKKSDTVQRDKAVDNKQMSDYELELKAADGNAQAQYELGKRWVLKGDSVNVAKGVNWLTASARQGNPAALYALGKLYYNGYGVERNLSLAYKLMQQSASKGYAKAKSFLKSNHF